MRNDNWTTEETQQLLDMIAGGSTYREVATRLGRTPTAVKSRAGRLSRVPPPPDEMPAWDEMPVAPVTAHGTITLRIGQNEVSGTPEDMARLLGEMG